MKGYPIAWPRVPPVLTGQLTLSQPRGTLGQIIPKAKLLLLKLIHLFAREVLLVKRFEIEETM